MKRVALLAACLLSFGCGDAPEDDDDEGSGSGRPHDFAVSRYDAGEPGDTPDSGDDERAGAAEVCGPDTDTQSGEQPDAACYRCAPRSGDPHETPAVARTPDSVACPLAESAPE